MPPPHAPCFFVGGRYVADNSDHVMVGQMYVQRHGEIGGPKLPVVLLHGNAQTGAHWEQTPDGRPGFAELLSHRGHAVYVVDLPGIGRSRYHHPSQGPLTHYSAEFMERLFTATSVHGGWPGAELHTQWPGSGRVGDPVFDAFYASQVGHFTVDQSAEPAARAAGTALLDLIGPCHFVTHSHGAPAGWHIADSRPDLVRSIIALEPKGPPFFGILSDTSGVPLQPYGITSTPLTYAPPLLADVEGLPYKVSSQVDLGVQQVEPPRRLPRLADVPVLVITAEASYHTTYDHRTVHFLRVAGVPVEHTFLADHGIRGNGHLMAVERNNDRIAELIADRLSAIY